MFNGLTFSNHNKQETENRKLENLKQKHKIGLSVFEKAFFFFGSFIFCKGWVSLKEPLKKCRQLSYFIKLNFFEKTLKKMQTIFIFCKVWFLLKKLGKIQGGFQTCCTRQAFYKKNLRHFRVLGWSWGRNFKKWGR
jgi:hypothetical protein